MDAQKVATQENLVNKLKKEIKVWEQGFAVEVGRKPNKDDIEKRNMMSKYVAYNQAKQKLDALRTPSTKTEPTVQKQETQRTSTTDQTNDENHVNLNIDKYWQKKQPVVSKKPANNCALLSRLKDADDVLLNVTSTPKKASKSEDTPSTKQTTKQSTVPASPFTQSKPKPQPQQQASSQAPSQTHAKPQPKSEDKSNVTNSNDNNEPIEMDPASLSVIPFSQIGQSSRWRRSASLLHNKEKLQHQLAQLQQEIEQEIQTSESESDSDEEEQDVTRTPKRVKTESSQNNTTDSQSEAMDIETAPEMDEKTLTAASLAKSFSGTRTNFVKQKLKSSNSSNNNNSPFGKFRKNKTNFTSFKKLKRAQTYGGEYLVTDNDNPFFGADSLDIINETISIFNVNDTSSMDEDFENQRNNQTKQFAPISLTDKELTKNLKQHFGFSTFRPGQKEAVQRILRGESTLLVIPTGSGKSLCYQLPAMLYPADSVVLVISPLLSLIRDQLNNMPSCLTAASLTSQQTLNESNQILKDLKNNKIKILFVSPEKLISEKFIQIIRAHLPPIAFVCIDEAHCISEWSHNFRTSYLRLNDVLRRRLNVKCVLALTATATKRTEKSIGNLLGISSEGVIRIPTIRENLHPTVSLDQDRHKALVDLLHSDRFAKHNSIIIYVMLQKQADEIANHLQQSAFDAMSYHAGKSLKERQRVQDLFMHSKLRIVVATVAFGMGLDKQDVRAVIHFNIPKSLENYIQEIGRAGRDGLPADCHLFLGEEDYIKTRSLGFSDFVDAPTVKKLLQTVFKCHSGSSTPKKKKGQKAFLTGMCMDTVERDLDLRKEVISTVLSYLDLDDYIKILPNVFMTCEVGFHNSDPHTLAAQDQLFAWIVKNSKVAQGRHQFDMIQAANGTGMEINHIQQELLRYKQEKGEISFEFRDNAFCVRVLMEPEDIVELTNAIVSKMKDLETSRVSKVDVIYSIMKRAAFASISETTDKTEKNKREKLLQQSVDEYFTTEELNCKFELDSKHDKQKGFLKADIKAFLKRHYVNQVTTGRSVARIFHGISSPAFPAVEWGSNLFWGRHKESDFNEIVVAATEEIINFKLGNK